MSNFMENYQPNFLINECTHYIPFAMALDISGSMTNRLADGKTQYDTAVDTFSQFLPMLAENATLAENVHLFLYVFGGDTVRCIVDGKALCSLDIPQLTQQLRSISCSGKTPMGQCIVEMLDKLEETKRVVSRAALSYSQPILSIIGDGLPTDNLDEAKRRIYAMMEQAQQKLLFLPVGIGAPGMTFDVFDLLLNKDKTETPVVCDAAGLKAYFKLLNKTVRSIGKGEFITPSTQFGQVRTIAQKAALNAQRDQLLAGGDY